MDPRLSFANIWTPYVTPLPTYLAAPRQITAGPANPQSTSGTHIQPTSRPKKRQRRLQFSSEIRAEIQRYNADGTESVEWLQHQSAQRLKQKWESIFERFKDAHLQDQDEIYLGNRDEGEPIVVIKDRGVLRSIKRRVPIGFFIKDEELQGWRDRPEAQQPSSPSPRDPTSATMWQDHAPRHHPANVGRFRVVTSDDSDGESDNSAHVSDPDLRDFLRAEAQRKALQGTLSGDADENADEEDDDEDDVIDFGDPQWSDSLPAAPRGARAAKHGRPIWEPELPVAATSLSSRRRRSASLPDPNRRASPASDGGQVGSPCSNSSANDDVDDDDIDDDDEDDDEDEDFDDIVQTKRQNIEDLLRCTSAFETLPYDDVYGLADLLGLVEKSSRLYVDLVSEDEEIDTRPRSRPHFVVSRPLPPVSPSPSLSPSPAVMQANLDAEASHEKADAGTSTFDSAGLEVVDKSNETQSLVEPEHKHPDPPSTADPVDSATDLAGAVEQVQQVAQETIPAVDVSTVGTFSAVDENVPATTALLTVSTPVRISSTTPKPTMEAEAQTETEKKPAEPVAVAAAVVPAVAAVTSPAESRLKSKSTDALHADPTRTASPRGGQHDPKTKARIRPAAETPRTSLPSRTTRITQPAPAGKTARTTTLNSALGRLKPGKRSSAAFFSSDDDDEDDDEGRDLACGGPERCSKTFCLVCASLRAR